MGAVLRVCAEWNISLKATKTKVGFPTASFAGFEIGHGSRRLAEKHIYMQPLLDMAPPKDVSGMRRILGLCVQSKSLIRNYAILTKPLSALTGKIKWHWVS